MSRSYSREEYKRVTVGFPDGGIHYGKIIDGQYTVESAYCWTCDLLFPQICAVCPKCLKNNRVRRYSRQKMVQLRKLQKRHESKLQNPSWLQWCDFP